MLRTIALAVVATLVGLAADAQAQGSAKGAFINAQGANVGSADLTQEAGHVVIRLNISGVPTGWHGLHLHAVGKCDGPDFASAGGHFNPGGKKHGHRAADGSHAGDLPNVYAGADGKVITEVLAGGVTLGQGGGALFDADGSALVVHAGEDDHKTDPTGGSGGRIACAVLTR